MTYHFYKIALNQKWWHIGQAPSTSSGGAFYSPHRQRAALFTEADWQAWGEAEGLQREAVEDRGMTGEQAGLPGLGGTF